LLLARLLKKQVGMNDSRGIEFRERAFRFTCDIFDFCEELAAQPGMRRRVAYQLFDAVSSIGANLEEAKAAYSRRDFASKNSISLRASNKTAPDLMATRARASYPPAVDLADLVRALFHSAQGGPQPAACRVIWASVQPRWMNSIL
jgi:four helix bundle protein